MRKRIIAVAIAVMSALVLIPATSASAYLHVATAESYCATPAQLTNMAWRQSNGWSTSVWWTNDSVSKRASDSDVRVHDMVWGQGPATRGDYICHVTGSDSNVNVQSMTTAYQGPYWAGTLAW